MSREQPVPYRIDLGLAPDDALERLIDLGALDVEASRDGGIAALLPDNVPVAVVAGALGRDDLTVTPAAGRDADSVWILTPRAVGIGRVRLVPAHLDAEPGAIRLLDTAAFGTGLHPTTALCLEALDEELQVAIPDAVLDVGTGSGVLALAALTLGVPRVTAIDVDDEALRVAAENAAINGVADRLQLARGGPGTIAGTWPLVLANVLAAPLIEMAPALVQRVARRGRLVLSGIPVGVESDTAHAYRHLGMHLLRSIRRAGWSAVIMQASW